MRLGKILVWPAVNWKLYLPGKTAKLKAFSCEMHNPKLHKLLKNFPDQLFCNVIHFFVISKKKLKPLWVRKWGKKKKSYHPSTIVFIIIFSLYVVIVAPQRIALSDCWQTGRRGISKRSSFASAALMPQTKCAIQQCFLHWAELEDCLSDWEHSVEAALLMERHQNKPWGPAFCPTLRTTQCLWNALFVK